MRTKYELFFVYARWQIKLFVFSLCAIALFFLTFYTYGPNSELTKFCSNEKFRHAFISKNCPKSVENQSKWQVRKHTQKSCSWSNEYGRGPMILVMCCELFVRVVGGLMGLLKSKDSPCTMYTCGKCVPERSWCKHGHQKYWCKAMTKWPHGQGEGHEKNL